MPQIIKEIVVRNAQGLHARPAALFVQIASRYNSDVTIQRGNEKVNGKSIMGILTLGVQPGMALTLEVKGGDAEKVALELEELLTRDSIE
jgi:phosphocarrier protein